jgi:DNA repair protein RecO (recombination protein O)
MDWTDTGIVLSARKHGENGVILSLMTEGHGRHLGLVRGGTGRRSRGLYQPGNAVSATWRARLEDHLGSYSCELVQAHAAAVLDDPVRLAGLSALVAVIEAALPERETHPRLYRDAVELVANMTAPDWLEHYVRFELVLLRDLGFGLDLTSCAATGRNDQLAYVSPRTGRAVSASAGEPYRDKLLPLPAFLTGENRAAPAEVLQGLQLTGYFLERTVFAHAAKGPAARTRLVERLREHAG